MTTQIQITGNATTTHELWFQSLFDGGRGFSFPCDGHGTVDTQSLSNRLSDTYLFVRSLVGHDFAMPRVREQRKESHREGH